MAFLDYPFSRSLPSFLPHKDVKQYLTNYSEHFDLTQYIQVCSKVFNDILTIGFNYAVYLNLSYF